MESSIDDYLNAYLEQDTKAVIAIIRPLNEIRKNGYVLSNNAKQRLLHPRVSVVKRTSVQRNGSSNNRAQLGKYDSVNLGDIINYEIEVRNKYSSKQEVVVEENIPANTTFYAATADWCSANDSKTKVTCRMTFDSGQQKTFFIRVKVNNDMSLLGKDIVSTGSFNGIPNKTITTKINKTLTDDEINDLVKNKVKPMDGKTFNGYSHDFINSVYSEIGYSDLNITSANDVFSKLFSISDYTITSDDTSFINYILKKPDDIVKIFTMKDNVEDAYKKYTNMYVDGLFGGFYTKSSKEPGLEVKRNKTFTTTTLMPGDVLYVYDSNYKKDLITSKCGFTYGEKNAYLYLGNGEFATVSSNKVKVYKTDTPFTYCIFNPDRTTEITLNLTGLKNITIGERLLISLLGQDSYIVLRPSYSFKYKLTGIEIEKTPSKVEYIQSKENIDLTGGKLKLIYGNYGNETIDLNSESVTVSNFNNNILGNNDVIVNYGGLSTSFKVNIVENNAVVIPTQRSVLESISLVKMPYKTTYIQNKESLDLTGGTLALKYNDHYVYNVKLTSPNVRVFGFDNNKLGKQLLVVDYLGVKTTLEVNIIGDGTRNVEKIEIEELPTKTNYTQNIEILDLTDGTIKITYDDQTTEITNMDSPNISVSNFDNSNICKETIDIKYMGEETSFEVEIKDRTIDSVQIIQEPTKTNYSEKERLDLDGGKIEVKYSDNTTEVVSLNSPNIKVTKKANNNVENNAIVEIDYYGNKDLFNVEVLDVEEFIADDNEETPTVDTYTNEDNKYSFGNTAKAAIIVAAFVLIVLLIIIKKKKQVSF